MGYRVERALDTDRDLEAIFDFLRETYQNFGEEPGDAFDRAALRIEAIEADMLALGDLPHQGTLRRELFDGLRSVTKNRAIFYFVPDDAARVVRVLAIFFGGQDHQRAMLKRLARD